MLGKGGYISIYKCFCLRLGWVFCPTTLRQCNNNIVGD